MQKLKSYIILTALSLLTACDCVQKANGVILEKSTRRPIAHVAYGKYKEEDLALTNANAGYSDSSGHFSYYNISGGLFHCPDVEICFSKKGYITQKNIFDGESFNDTVLLVPVR